MINKSPSYNTKILYLYFSIVVWYVFYKWDVNRFFIIIIIIIHKCILCEQLWGMLIQNKTWWIRHTINPIMQWDEVLAQFNIPVQWNLLNFLYSFSNSLTYPFLHLDFLASSFSAEISWLWVTIERPRQFLVGGKNDNLSRN